MSDHGHYCPFLNRADARCSTHFQLDHLGAAFEHCFDHYHDCTVYAELLEERQQRRAAAAAESRVGFWAQRLVERGQPVPAGVAAGESAPTATSAPPPTRPPAPRVSFTPLTVANRHAQPAPDGSGVPPVSGF